MANKFTSKEVLNKVLLDSSGNAVTANSVTAQEALNSALDTTNNRLNMSLAGGTISGDVTISGDLTVNGSSTYTYDEQIDGQLWLKDSTASSASQGGHLKLFSDDGAAMAAGHRLGVIEFAGAEDASSTITVGARIEALAESTYTSSENGSALLFYTTDGNASQSEGMRITSDGKVGMGTSGNVDSQLHVQDDSSNCTVKIEASASGTGARLQMISATNDTAEFYLGDSGDSNIGRISYNHTSNYLAIHTNDTEQMRIDSSGDVGVGTQAPNYNSTAKALTVLGGNSEDIGSVEIIGHTDSGSTAVARLYMGNRAGSQDDLVYLETKTGSGTSDGDLLFYTSASGTPAERMRIYSHGATLIKGQAYFGDDNFRIYSEGSGGSDNQIILCKYNNLQLKNQHNGGNIQFYTDTSGGTAVLNMIIDADSKISLSNNDGNSNNTVFGKSAFNDGGSDVGADYNVAIGELAMGTGTIAAAQSNTAIGYRALTDITGNGGGGDDNVAIGYDAATNLTTGRSSVAIGKDSLATATTTNYCVAIGESAGTAISHSDGAGQVLIGYQAGHDLTSGAGNTMIGKFAGDKTVLNSYNTYVGFENGRGDGFSNVAIGAQSFDHTGGQADKCVIIGTQAMRGDHQSGADETVAVGAASLAALITGEHNVAIGFQSQNANTDYDNNTSVGHDSLRHGNGNNNTAIGRESGLSISTGSQNTFLGASSGGGASGSSNRITSNNNTGIGYKSLYDAKTNAEKNTAVGSLSGENISTGDNNTLVGFQCGLTLETTTHNTAIGVDALGGSSLVSNATVIGSQACDAAVTADADGVVAIGYAALGALTSGAANVAIGYQALDAITTSANNTAIGYQALTDCGDSYSNVAIGKNAGDTITNTGGLNTVIGTNADVSAGAATSQIAIGNGVTSTQNHETVIAQSIWKTVTKAVTCDLGGDDQNDPSHAAAICKIPRYAVITKACALVTTLSNQGNHTLKLCLSTDSSGTDGTVLNNVQDLISTTVECWSGRAADGTNNGIAVGSGDTNKVGYAASALGTDTALSTLDTTGADLYVYLAHNDNNYSGSDTDPTTAPVVEVLIEYVGKD